jgi:hypothetical protein
MCAQLRVGGSGTAVPAQAEMVKFPGAYSGSEGALNKNGYHYRRQAGGAGGEAFEFPGPKVAVLAGGEGGASGVPSVPSTGVPPSPSTAPLPAPAPEAPVPQQQQPGTYAGEGSCSTNYKRDMVRRRVPIDAARGQSARRSAH